jgi:hypothetical protein
MYIRCEPIADGRIRVHVDIFQITRAKAHTKKLESTELFLQTLFPHGREFAEFVILYRIVTPYRNLSQFRLNPKSRSGIPEITNNWDAQFSWPDSFGVVYFDEDIPFSCIVSTRTKIKSCQNLWDFQHFLRICLLGHPLPQDSLPLLLSCTIVTVLSKVLFFLFLFHGSTMSKYWNHDHAVKFSKGLSLTVKITSRLKE